MFTLAVVLISPTVMLAIAWLLSGRRAKSLALSVWEWLANAIVLTVFTFMVCYPIDRVSVHPWIGHPLSFFYGKSAAAFSISLAVALGAFQGIRKLYWAVDTAAPRPRLRETLWRIPLHLIALVLIVLTFGYLWGIRAYPIISLEEIVFHLYMPLQGTAKSFVQDVLINVALPSAVAFALIELLIWLPYKGPTVVLRGTKHIRLRLAPPRYLPLPLTILLLAGAASLLYACFDRYLDLTLFLRSHARSSTLIEQEYVDPAQTALVFPEDKRNLITIYIESGETTFQDRESGGIADVNYMPEMTRIAAQNVTFSQSELIEGAAVTPGAGWTSAALVAQTTGLPLKLLSNTSGDWMSDFLPGATSLGDILKEHGYRTVFMAGSDFAFGGREQFFTQHGDYEVWDLFTARETGRIAEDYYAGWGFEDRKLYAYAKDVLTGLAEDGQPFHFSMLTVDTHVPGFTYSCCPDDIDDHYMRTVACASRQLDEFITWCEQQPFFENTTIVISGDHISMNAPEAMAVDTQETNIYMGTADRLVYNAFINAVPTPVRASNRRFTTLDLFPSVLASLGVQIEGERLGLGTNLFSGRETLAEEYGYDTLFSELISRSSFYNEHLLYPAK